MKCLLIMPRWSEQETLFPPSGRPYLDLQLNCLGFSEIGIMELEPDAPFDPAAVSEEYRLVLVQGSDESGSRLRRSLLSNLGLSLGLDGDESDRLKVMGATPLYDSEGFSAGFAIKRRGRMVAYCEKSIWALRVGLVTVLRSFLEEDKPIRRGRYDSCWMVEGSGEPLDSSELMVEEEYCQCRTRYLPNGDTALLIPGTMGAEYKKRLEGQLGDSIYARAPRSLEELLSKQLRNAKLTLAVAESCTGGLVSARLSAIPGCSDFLTSGYVTYSNIAKTNCLDVSSILLERCGAVSQEVALDMARGALRNGKADLAVSVTGIAGPEGGTTDKPVGTVCLAAVSNSGDTLQHRSIYRGDRNRVRYQASQTALHMLRRMLLNYS